MDFEAVLDKVYVNTNSVESTRQNGVVSVKRIEIRFSPKEGEGLVKFFTVAGE